MVIFMKRCACAIIEIWLGQRGRYAQSNKLLTQIAYFIQDKMMKLGYVQSRKYIALVGWYMTQGMKLGYVRSRKYIALLGWYMTQGRTSSEGQHSKG